MSFGRSTPWTTSIAMKLEVSSISHASIESKILLYSPCFYIEFSAKLLHEEHGD